MLDILLQGITLGFVLAIMVGPLTVSLLHTSMEKGKQAGFLVAMGIWISDFLFMLSVFFGFQYLEKLIQFAHFEQFMGIAGSIILTIIGIGILKKRNEPAAEAVDLSKKDLAAAVTQGFSINTVNPFTFIFWTSVMGAVVIKNNWTTPETLVFFGGIMGTIMTTDSLKVILSVPLHKWLTPRRWKTIKLVSGISFLMFGIVLLVRVFL